MRRTQGREWCMCWGLWHCCWVTTGLTFQWYVLSSSSRFGRFQSLNTSILSTLLWKPQSHCLLPFMDCLMFVSLLCSDGDITCGCLNQQHESLSVLLTKPYLFIYSNDILSDECRYCILSNPIRTFLQFQRAKKSDAD